MRNSGSARQTRLARGPAFEDLEARRHRAAQRRLSASPPRSRRATGSSRLLRRPRASRARATQRLDSSRTATPQVGAPCDTGGGSRRCASPPGTPSHTSRSVRSVSPWRP